MAFKLVLATAPTEEVSASLSLRFLAKKELVGKANLSFGTSAQVAGVVLAASSWGPGLVQRAIENFAEEMKPDVEVTRFDVLADLYAQDGQVSFGLKNLGSNDTLSIVALTRRLFVGNVIHGPRSTFFSTTKCIATCADGTSAQGCVTCTQSGITVRVCC